MRLLLALLAALTPAPALAADWYFVDVAQNNSSAVYVDRASIRGQDGNVSRASVFTALRVPTATGVAALRIDMEVDCGEPRGRMFLLTAFREDRSRIDDQQGSGQWNPMAEGTQAGKIRSFVCSGGGATGDQQATGAELPFAHARALLERRQAQPR